MKKAIILSFQIILFYSAIAQTEEVNNGYNLKDHCNPSDCKYFKFSRTILFPLNDGTDWEMANAEIAIKDNGSYILTGDMDVKGEEMGAKLKFEIELYDANDIMIHKIETDEIEYYSDINYAEPIVLSGEMPSSIAKNMDFFNFLVVESKTLPYYELSTDCYGPCNNYQLTSSIKAFRKSK
jgi:hypothetical protein